MTKTQLFGLTLLVWMAALACWRVKPAVPSPLGLPTLPNQIGQWRKLDLRFCQNTNCESANHLVPFPSAELCPTCQSPTYRLSLSEQTFARRLAEFSVVRYSCQQPGLSEVRAWFCFLSPQETEAATDWASAYWTEMKMRLVGLTKDDCVQHLESNKVKAVGATNPFLSGTAKSVPPDRRAGADFSYWGAYGTTAWRWKDQAQRMTEAAVAGRKRPQFCVGLVCTYPSMSPAGLNRLKQNLLVLSSISDRYLKAAVRKQQ